MIEELNKNIDIELATIREIAFFLNQIPSVSDKEKILMRKTIDSLKNKIKIINNSVPAILKEIEIAQPLPNFKQREASLEKIGLRDGKQEMFIDKKFRDEFLTELKISEENIKKMKNAEPDEKEELIQYSNKGYKSFSNRLFIGLSKKLVREGYFSGLSMDLRKGNMDYLTETYVSVIFMTSFLMFIMGLGIAVLFTFFSYDPSKILVPFTGDYLLRAAKLAILPVILGVLTFVGMYIYPRTERSDAERKINQELSFAVVYMSSISGAGIEPSAIFKIISAGNEYPYLRKEMRKVLNQMNIYGYDLVTSLMNISRNCPSKRLGELFSGMANTITSGGSLTEFFQKRAESLIVEYRLEREKYTKLAETSMDLYITVVIAAPMVILLIFVLLSISNFGISLSPVYLTFIMIGIIALINVIFLGILQFKQPEY